MSVPPKPPPSARSARPPGRSKESESDPSAGLGSPFDADPVPVPVPRALRCTRVDSKLGRREVLRGGAGGGVGVGTSRSPALPACPPRSGDPGVGFGSGNLTPDPDEEGGACCGLELTPKTGGSALALPNPHDCCCCNPAPAPGAGCCCCCGGLPALLSPPARVGNVPVAAARRAPAAAVTPECSLPAFRPRHRPAALQPERRRRLRARRQVGRLVQPERRRDLLTAATQRGPPRRGHRLGAE